MTVYIATEGTILNFRPIWWYSFKDIGIDNFLSIIIYNNNHLVLTKITYVKRLGWRGFWLHLIRFYLGAKRPGKSVMLFVFPERDGVKLRETWAKLSVTFFSSKICQKLRESSHRGERSN